MTDNDDTSAAEAADATTEPSTVVVDPSVTSEATEDATTTTTPTATSTSTGTEDSTDTVTADAGTPTSNNGSSPPSPSPSSPSPLKRNPSTDSMRSIPLPSIQECLFGIPKDDDEDEKDNNDNNATEKEEDEEEDELQYMVPSNLLRRVSSQGIDDDDEKGISHRALAWRVLLGFLPVDRRKWTEVAHNNRQSYNSFVQELFCLRPHDIDGKQLRGHHSKRHDHKHKKDKKSKEERKQERLERRQERQQQREQQLQQNGSGDSGGEQQEDGEESDKRLPIKFVDEMPRTQSYESTDDDDSDDDGGGDDNDNPDLVDETNQNEPKKQLSSSDLLQGDDLSVWNMSVREQKILERLTNHDAINQLLVKRDCKEWNNFLENATLLDEIRKDVNRTHPHLYFYLEPHHQLGPRRYAALERILFVWAKLNKGVSHVMCVLVCWCCVVLVPCLFVSILLTGTRHTQDVWSHHLVLPSTQTTTTTKPRRFDMCKE